MVLLPVNDTWQGCFLRKDTEWYPYPFHVESDALSCRFQPKERYPLTGDICFFPYRLQPNTLSVS